MELAIRFCSIFEQSVSVDIQVRYRNVSDTYKKYQLILFHSAALV